MRWIVYLGAVIVACYIAGEAGPPMGLGTMLVIIVGGWLWERHRLEQDAIRRELAELKRGRAE